MLPALIPTASQGGLHIDIGAHLGGLVAGVLIAFILLKNWPASSMLPPGRKFASVVSVLGLVAILASSTFVFINKQDRCTGFTEDAEHLIPACSRIIQNPQANPQELSRALSYRGMAYLKQKQNSLALFDLNRAVSLDASPVSLTARGTLFKALHRDDEAIQDYTRIIDLIKGPNVSPTFFGLRASVYIDKGEFIEAEEDINKALSISPSNIFILMEQARMYLSQGEYTKAIVALDKAIQINLTKASLYWTRGQAKMLAGSPALAINDLETAVRLDPSNSYQVLWLHIARIKSGQDDQQELQTNSLKLSPNEWPRPLIDLYLHQSTIDDVVARAKTGDVDTQHDQLCEANFYVGEFYLQQGNKPYAKQFLQEASNGCPVNFVEYPAIRVDLKNLDQ